MRNFTANEILKLTEKEIDDLIINYTFEFETNSEIETNSKSETDLNLEDKKCKFTALVLDQTLADNTLPFDLQILINGKIETIDLSIINIKSMKYVC